ncbi:OmpA family protein [Paraburkholderia sp. CNPSo 3272]|uniref:OmpA family protein n=1 Tax=Paraburkholderia sp. CNPSo 3272 TaxID=2940931 RepID=UPI0020B7CC87|nr:OmpA family protein [Paraburkholderia sp. CNPSo 3272]MCP3723963.1 OmpA family protein [Paraburkholderia sp. CNPSo 3272]
MQPIDRIDRARAADDKRSDPRVLLFTCSQEASSNTSTETGAVEQEATMLENFAVGSDALFPFGKSAADTMSPSAKAELDAIAQRIPQHEQVNTITVVGHADRLGPESLNGALSLARANTVRDYLVAHGLDGSIIHAKGVGSSQPRTHCVDDDARALIACLQQDRYVSITVQGRR